MPYPHFSKETLDDLMRSVYEDILQHGDAVEPTKGATIERTGVLLQLVNPRARLSRTETKGHAFSALGELCWYLSGSRDVESIAYYISDYAKYAEDGIVWGGYGPRLFDWKGQNQVENVLSLLRSRHSSRRAVVQVFDAVDIAQQHEDVPCTCTLQLLMRNDKLNLIVAMRSNDGFKGLPHDVFAFTMLQEIMARSLDVSLGTYNHFVGSLHLYESDRSKVQAFLDEGFQSTEIAMPEMPKGDPWPALRRVGELEAAIRIGTPPSSAEVGELDPYWADLVRLLMIFRYAVKEHDREAVVKVSERMASTVYRPYVQRQLDSNALERL